MSEEAKQETEATPSTESFENMIAQVRAEDSGEAPKEEDTVPAAEATEPAEAEGETAQDKEEEEGDDSADEGEEEETAEKPEGEPKKRKMWGEREREAKLQERARADEAERRLAAAEEKAQKLQEFINKVVGGNEDAGSEDGEEITPVDEEAYNALKKKIEGIEQQREVDRFQSTVDRQEAEARSTMPGYETAFNRVVAIEAREIMVRAAAIGRDIEPEQAIKEATKTLPKKAFEIYKSGGNVARYFYQRALDSGFSPEGVKPAEKAKVDMKAVERARKEAGAPAVEKASTEAQKYGFRSMLAEVKREKAAEDKAVEAA